MNKNKNITAEARDGWDGKQRAEKGDGKINVAIGVCKVDAPLTVLLYYSIVQEATWYLISVVSRKPVYHSHFLVARENSTGRRTRTHKQKLLWNSEKKFGK